MFAVGGSAKPRDVDYAEDRIPLILGEYRVLAQANYPIDLVGQDGKRRHLTTNARGEVHLPADARGMMMLFAAKLEPPAGAGRFTLDLTSLTFSRT